MYAFFGYHTFSFDVIFDSSNFTDKTYISIRFIQMYAAYLSHTKKDSFVINQCLFIIGSDKTGFYVLNDTVNDTVKVKW